ncbi:MAG: phage tail sheath subtilisin-like domain-containing protein, partial [Rhodospirillales bacterium]|nr:phage tail sheath subtilisin-like domain-containing protein [Rhodospirillales bacterium]
MPLDRPVLLTGPRQAAALLGTEGTLPQAWEALHAQGVREAVAVRVAEGKTAAATLANVKGASGAGTGVWAFEAAASLLDLTPRILAAPGFTRTAKGDPANPVTTDLIAVADKLRAVVVADGPNTNETDAKADRGNWGSDRLYIVDPYVTVYEAASQSYVERPASGYAAGLIARRDIERGFWWSPSNQTIAGISGTARPVGFHLSEPQTEANRMNEAEVATIVRRDGFRLWGNRGAGADAQWAFLSVRRTADI